MNNKTQILWFQNYMPKYLYFLILLVGFSCAAQEVTIIQNPKIDVLLHKRQDSLRALENVEVPPPNPITKEEICKIKRKTNGFRVVVAFRLSRAQVKKEQEKFKQHFPAIFANIQQNSPFFRLLAGDYLHKESAEKQLAKIQSKYVEAFIIASTIECRLVQA